MNKIERAIYDTKLHIEDLEREYLVLTSKIEAYKDQLLALECIADDKSIPYDERLSKVSEHELTNNPFTPTPGFIVDDLVPYGSICPCNPANGGSGICGCIMGNKMVPNPKKYGQPKTNIGTTTNSLNINDIKTNISHSLV